MYVPKGIYERAPYYWIILGVLLIVMGTYLVATGNNNFFAAGIIGGLIACVWGLRIVRHRLVRENRKICSTYDDYLTETCELNAGDIQRQDETA